MTHVKRHEADGCGLDATVETLAHDPAPIPLARLTSGRTALAIAHAGATYRLRVTRANKLILTKDVEDKAD